MEVKIDTSKPVENKWKPYGDWRFMLAMATLLPIATILGRGQNPLSMNIPALIGSFLAPVVIVGVVWLFNKK
jgi:hypothetical protein